MGWGCSRERPHPAFRLPRPSVNSALCPQWTSQFTSVGGQLVAASGRPIEFTEVTPFFPCPPVITSACAFVPPINIDRMAELRMRRRQRLGEDGFQGLTAVMTEGVIRTMVGG